MLIPTLFVLAFVKFVLVVLWFMHLKFDDRRYARFFVMGLALACHAVPDRADHVPGVPGVGGTPWPPSWHLHPDVWLLFGSIVAAYLIAVPPARSARRAKRPRAGRRRLFLLGMGVLWLGADWPIHDLAERYLYFMHMTQHLLFTLVAAPILIAGHAAVAAPRSCWPRGRCAGCSGS